MSANQDTMPDQPTSGTYTLDTQVTERRAAAARQRVFANTQRPLLMGPGSTSATLPVTAGTQSPYKAGTSSRTATTKDIPDNTLAQTRQECMGCSELRSVSRLEYPPCSNPWVRACTRWPWPDPPADATGSQGSGAQ